MPTGYTAKIYNGEPQTFEEFALDCARAFGAMVMMRDLGRETKITRASYTERTDYHVNGRRKARERLRALVEMGAESRAAGAADENMRVQKQWEDETRARSERFARYEAMLERINQWDPPTDEHVGLKEFMVEQVTRSIDFDCGDDVFPRPEGRSPAEWHAREIERANSDLAYHAREIEKIAERNEARHAWISALFSSLGMEAPE